MLGKGLALVAGVLLLALSCGDIHQAPYGSKLTMPTGGDISSSTDMVFVVSALVLGPDAQPIDNVDVEFYVCCGGVQFAEGGTETTIKSDKTGVATVNVLIPGTYEGDISVTASIGIDSGETKITKKIPSI